jgi:hypothetical protein
MKIPFLEGVRYRDQNGEASQEVSEFLGGFIAASSGDLFSLWSPAGLGYEG